MLTLKDAIDSYIINDDPDARMYGRLLAACGGALQGWANDETSRGHDLASIFFAIIRLCAGMTGSMIARSGSSDINRGADLLGEMFAEHIKTTYEKITQSDPEELLAVLARAAEQAREPVGAKQ
jgi:hypothetical protein